jgi:hypothetical protein
MDVWRVGIRSYGGVGRPVRLGVLLVTGRCSAELPSPLIKSIPAYVATPWESANQSTKKVQPPVPLGPVAVQGKTDWTLHHGETYDISSLSTRDRCQAYCFISSSDSRSIANASAAEGRVSIRLWSAATRQYRGVVDRGTGHLSPMIVRKELKPGVRWIIAVPPREILHNSVALKQSGRCAVF